MYPQLSHLYEREVFPVPTDASPSGQVSHSQRCLTLRTERWVLRQQIWDCEATEGDRSVNRKWVMSQTASVCLRALATNWKLHVYSSPQAYRSFSPFGPGDSEQDTPLLLFFSHLWRYLNTFTIFTFLHNYCVLFCEWESQSLNHLYIWERKEMNEVLWCWNTVCNLQGHYCDSSMCHIEYHS